MNMFKPVKATSVHEYLQELPPERREPVEFLHTMIQQTAPELKPHFAHNMLGYGSFPYRNYKKEMIEWPVIALASQKQYMSLYVCALDGGRYLAEKYAKDLGKVSVGKSCIRFRRLEDLHLLTVKKMIKEAAKKPGLPGTEGKKG